MNFKQRRQHANAFARADARRPYATPSVTQAKRIDACKARRRTNDAGVMHRIAESLPDAGIDDAGDWVAQMHQDLFTFTARGALVLNRDTMKPIRARPPGAGYPIAVAGASRRLELF